MKHYWKLIKWDGESINVKPENVKFVQDKLDTGQGFIKTFNRSIAVRDIKDFIESDEIYTDQKLLETGAQLFDEPLMNEDKSVICRWVKKEITKREFGKNYSQLHAYKILEESDNHVVVAWRQPVHLINLRRTTELTDDDELRFSKVIS